EVIQVAKELIETVNRRQEFVAIAQMVFSKLSSGISQRLHHVADGRILGAQTDVGARQANLSKPGADRRLSGDECSTSCGAALLSIPVSEKCAFFRYAIDVRSPISHHAQVVSADVVPTNVVAHYEKDVGFLLCHSYSSYGLTIQSKSILRAALI